MGRVFKTKWFAKAARKANIEDDELADFRKLAKIYAEASDDQIDKLLANNALTEICL